MKYKIGQVLYVLLSRETKICPVQVVEEITKRTLNGETTNYIVKIGKKGETMSLSEMGGQVFESIDSLRQTLFDRIARSVETIIMTSISRAKEWYPNQVEPDVTSQHSVSSAETSTDEDAVITLPDGTTAKIRMPFPGV